MKIKRYPILALTSLFIFSSCTEEKEEAKNLPTEKSPDLTSLVLEAEPEAARSISLLRSSAKPGDQVTFSGDILGSADVFMDGRAVMIMGDPAKLTACNLIPGDECETPWDVCCDDPEVVTASIVTVQALDGSGTPVKEGFKGLAGIAELSTLVVTGEVAEGSSEKNMLVNASGIFVKN